MKLYLSSYHLGDKPEQLINLVGDNKKAAVIMNAMDFLTDAEAYRVSVQREIDDLKGLGFQPEQVDLRDYFGKADELATKMAEYGLVWVRGGNVFILRRAFAQSGMDKWLISQKNNKELVYGGFSAGVCVLSPTLNGLELVDNPDSIPDGYNRETIWDGSA